MNATALAIPVPQLYLHVLRTLLYYDIWNHPLTAKELFTFLPINSMTFQDFENHLDTLAAKGLVDQSQGFYFVKGKTLDVVARRTAMENHARSMWRKAQVAMHIIRRFPFVRAAMVSGDLSKNVTNSESDVDFFIITESNRLWIARTLLILFKKIFLLNSKKYFCLNSFVTVDNLELDERSLFLATEVATLKPLYNTDMFHRYLAANTWILDYFPNWIPAQNTQALVHDRRSVIQRVLEFPFKFLPADALDTYLLEKMKTVWARRYPEFDEETRNRVLRCTKNESRAYVGNFQDKILALYRRRLEEFKVAM